MEGRGSPRRSAMLSCMAQHQERSVHWCVCDVDAQLEWQLWLHVFVGNERAVGASRGEGRLRVWFVGCGVGCCFEGSLEARVPGCLRDRLRTPAPKDVDGQGVCSYISMPERETTSLSLPTVVEDDGRGHAGTVPRISYITDRGGCLARTYVRTRKLNIRATAPCTAVGTALFCGSHRTRPTRSMMRDADFMHTLTPHPPALTSAAARARTFEVYDICSSLLRQQSASGTPGLCSAETSLFERSHFNVATAPPCAIDAIQSRPLCIRIRLALCRQLEQSWQALCDLHV